MLRLFSHCCCFDCFSYWQSKEPLWPLVWVLSLFCRPWIGFTVCEGVLSAVRRNKYHCGPGRVWTWRQWHSLQCLATYVGSLQVLVYSQIMALRWNWCCCDCDLPQYSFIAMLSVAWWKYFKLPSYQSGSACFGEWFSSAERPRQCGLS